MHLSSNSRYTFYINIGTEIKLLEDSGDEFETPMEENHSKIEKNDLIVTKLIKLKNNRAKEKTLKSKGSEEKEKSKKKKKVEPEIKKVVKKRNVKKPEPDLNDKDVKPAKIQNTKKKPTTVKKNDSGKKCKSSKY